MENNKIGNFIAKMRKEKNLTQQQLGDKLYVTDKAVSKWERGKSLPDITLLTKLSLILDVKVEDILAGEINENNNIVDIDKRVEEIQENIKKENKKLRIKYILLIILLLFILITIIFKYISFGYSIKEYIYNNSIIKIGIPQGSFNVKNNDRSISFKNLRSKLIVKEEMKNYLKTLDYLTCNDTIYYYDNENNISIINYKVKEFLLFSKIDLLIDNDDYCYNQKINDYGKLIDNNNYGMNVSRKIVNGKLEDIEGRISYVIFLDSDNKKDFKINVKVLLQHNTYSETLEESRGTFEIRNNKYIYVRDEIIKEDKRIKIPTVSSFKIENKKLILENNYLSKYTDKVILIGLK